MFYNRIKILNYKFKKYRFIKKIDKLHTNDISQINFIYLYENINHKFFILIKVKFVKLMNFIF